VRTLEEGHLLYDVLDTESDFAPYPVLVLPDAIPVGGVLLEKLQAYLAAGGRIFATGSSALDRNAGAFALDFGVRWMGEGAYMPVYLAPRFAMEAWSPAAHVAYSTAQTIVADDGAEVLADLQNPFFNRDYLHFCSHMHAPSTLQSAGPAMVRTANTTYLAVPGFQLYARNGQVAIRDIVLAGLRSLLPTPTLATSLPSQGLQTLMRDRATGRLIVHLLYGAPVRRGLTIPTRGITSIEVIEDLPPIADVAVALRMAAAPRRVYLAPQGQDIPFTYADGVVHCVVPRVECHQMVVAEP
jgi:hypothetical protein